VLPLRKDFAERIRKWLADKPDAQADEPLIRISDKRTAEMIRKDLAAARAKWLSEAQGDAKRKRRSESSFLAYCDDRGHVVDFHALRKTFITNLTRSGAAPKTTQMLSRHSDINLTMNTYTTLGVMDQVAAVEACRLSQPKDQATKPDNLVRQGPMLRTFIRRAGIGVARCPLWCREVPKMVPDAPHRASYGLHQAAAKTWT
jgi:hypothetical protein